MLVNTEVRADTTSAEFDDEIKVDELLDKVEARLLVILSLFAEFDDAQAAFATAGYEL